MHVIAIDGLTKHFGDIIAVNNLSLTVEQGEIFGFLGPNGAGKTTTIRLLLDFLRPNAGSVRVLDFDPQTNNVDIKRRVGYVPGEIGLPERMSSRAYLQYISDIRGGVDESRVAELAGRLQLDLDQVIKTLSKGNKQKLVLIQALMSKPDLLVLDEPTTGIDPIVQREFQTLLREHIANGGTVFLSSHLLDEVQHIADRVGIIREGKLVAVETVASLRERAKRHLTVTFGQDVPQDFPAKVQNLENPIISGRVLRAGIRGSDDALIKALAAFNVERFVSEAADLEDIFMSYYSTEPEEPNEE